MSVFPIDESSPVFSGVVKPGILQKLAKAIDAYCVKRSNRVVPDVTLRRSKREIARCRRLTRKSSAVRIEDAAAVRVSVGPSQ